MKELRKYFKGYMRETLLAPFFKLLEASLELLVPLIIARLIDTVIPHKDENHLLMMIFLLLVLASFGVVVALTAQYFSAKAAVGYSRQLSKDLYAKIMRLPQETRDRLTTASLVSRLTSDTFQIQTTINQFLRLFLRAPIIVFGSVIMAFVISPEIALWFVLMVILLALLLTLMTKLLNPLYLKIRQLTDKIVGETREQLEGMRVIRAFGQTKREIQTFRDKNTELTQEQLQTGNLATLISPATFLIVNVTLIVVIWHGNSAIAGGRLSQGMLVALANYLLQILTELLKLATVVVSQNQGYISAKRIWEVFEQKDEDIQQKLPVLESRDKALSVDHVTFTYLTAAKPSLEKITFDIKSSDFLGIIGGTGAGKSTVVQLLMRLYQPQEGQVTIFKDGHSPETLEEWRSWIGLVPQKAELFLGTVRSNLTLGLDQEVSDERLWWALDIAQASDFIREKEGRLDSPVEAFGRNFSGGQRQRLTIARAILRQTPFLILDDSTSALDYLTESKLLNAIKSELKDTTLIMISQRTNSLRQADGILVLDKGQQIAFGKHDDLLTTCDLYQEIHYSQHPREEGDHA